MKKVYQKKLAMYRTVRSVMVANETKWVGIPAFVSTMSKLNANIFQIDETSLKQSIKSNGTTLDNSALRTEIIDQANKISGALTAYANVSGNHKLITRISCSESQIKRETKSDFVNRIRHIIAAALNHEIELADYGILSSDIQQLQSEFVQFNLVIEEPRKVISERVVATSNLDTLFKETSHLLANELEQLMKIFKKDDVDFYLLFKSARTLVDPGFRGGVTEENAE